MAHPIAGARHWVKPENVHPLRAVQGAIHIETTVVENDHVALDKGIGPMLLGGDQGWIVGVESVIRLRWKASKRFQPYIVSVNGMGYAQGWRTSDVPYALTTSFGVGVLSRISKRLAITSDVKWYHHSNGMTLHGDKTRQFFNLAKASKNGGYQNLALSLGLLWSF